MSIIHATCISYKRKGILIIGKSGSGKSDLALRMIMQKGAKLVGDDYVSSSLSREGRGGSDSIFAVSPPSLQGLLEVRGVGIKKFPFIKKQKIHLVVELVDSPKKMERLPEEEFYELEGIKIKKIKLYPFELSALEKIVLSLAY